MYNNSQKNNDSINKSALTLSFFVHIILLLFLFWNIQWKNKSESLQTIEVELYNEIPGNAATTKKTKQVNNIQKKEIAKVIEPEKKLQNLVEKTPKVIDDRKADIELQKQKEKERLEKLEKLEKQKLLEKQRLEKEKEKQKQKEKELAKQKELEKQKELAKQKELEKQKAKKDLPKFDFRDGIDKDLQNTKNQKAIASDKNRDGNISDKTRGGVGNVTGRNVAGNTMRKVKARNLDAYINKIKNIVRSKVVLPPNLEGNPEMLLTVRQSQNGTILSVKINKSSGNELLDKSVVAAFHKSSPLPLPDDPDDFQNTLDVKYRPFD